MGECTHGLWGSAELGSNPDCAFLWLPGWQHAAALCYPWVSSLAKGHCHGPDLVAWPRALRVVFQQLLGLQKVLHEYRWSWSSASSLGLELGSHVGVSPWAPSLPPLLFAAPGQSESGGFYGAGNQTGSGDQRELPGSQSLNFGLGVGVDRGRAALQ